MKDDDIIEVIPLDPDSPSVQEALSVAQDQELDYVLIIGQKDDGWYFASSDVDNPMRAVFSAEQFRNYMMSM